MNATEQGQALERLRQSLRPLRTQLFKHEVYRSIRTQDDLRIFMEHHVFAVWDFMSLLKALQGRLTGVTIPWFPQGDRNARRLINEIVLEEESDEDGEGGYISHFELYRAAMAQCGANTSRIDAFMGHLIRVNRFLKYSLRQAYLRQRRLSSERRGASLSQERRIRSLRPLH